MPEKMTKEESRVQRAIEAARIAKQMLEATGSAFGIPDAEEVKVKRPKAEKDNTKPKKTEGTHSGYGSAGDEDEYKIKKNATEEGQLRKLKEFARDKVDDMDKEELTKFLNISNWDIIEA